MNIVDLSRLNTTRPESCKKTTYNMKCDLYTKIMHACDNSSFKKCITIFIHMKMMILGPMNSWKLDIHGENIIKIPST